jgi:nascent polypeptide-associated complex subunit alpha
MRGRELRRLLQRMKMKVEEFSNVQEVIIKTPSKEVLIEEPTVSVFEISGEKFFQITGKVTERKVEEVSIPEEDVQLVAQQAEVSPEEARKALEQTSGDLAQAILLLRTRG